MNQNKLLVIFFCFSFLLSAQRTSIGVFYGTSIGYNSVISDIESYHGLLDINFNELNSLNTIDDNNFSNNLEGVNGSVLGIRFNLPVTKGLSIQSELEYQQLDFNHIVYQNSNEVVYNDLDFALYGFQNGNQHKIANYFWRVNYFNFPFLLKLYPSNNFFFQLGAKFGFLLKAEESRALIFFNTENQVYTEYNVFTDERVVYEFFDSDSGVDSHGFDKTEWPFSWNAAIVGGLGYETKSIYMSIRYNVGLLSFFKEIDNKDDDFFETYNNSVDQNIYAYFNSEAPLLNNNFRLHSIHFVIGFQISN